VTAIAAGYYHTVALQNDGTVVTWGNKSSGQTAPTAYSVYDSQVSGTLSYNPATLTAIFTPAAPLVGGTYNVTVAGPRNLAGLPLATQTTWSFSVPSAAPLATTGTASNISLTGATLTGTVNDNGATTTVQFQYGSTTAYGSTLAAGTVPAGAGSTAFAANLSGLTCNTTYHYRITAGNSAGSVAGSDQFFTTSVCPVTYLIGGSVISGGGNISPSGTTQANSGDSITFTITPNSGYTLSLLSDNGVTVTAVPGTSGTFTYTINPVTATHTIQATFVVATAQAAPVPALGSWGVVVAAAGLGLFARRNRNRRTSGVV
jgi:hypothetical protein